MNHLPHIEEDILGKAYDHRLVRRLIPYLRPYTGYLIAAVFLSLILSGIELGIPYLFKLTIDKYILPGDFSGLLQMAVLFVVLLGMGFGIEFLFQYLVNYMGQKAIYDLRLQLFDHIQRFSVQVFDTTPVGRLMTRVTNDIQAINELFVAGVVNIVRDVFVLIGIVVMMLIINTKLALIVFLTIPLLIAVAENFRRNVRRTYRQVRTRLARLNAFMQETFSGIRTIQGYNREQKTFTEFNELNEALRKANIETVFHYAIFFPLVSFINSLGVALILWWGGGLALKNLLSLGSLFLFIQLIQRFFDPIQDLSERYNVFQSAMASAERIFRLFDTETEVEKIEPHIQPIQFNDSLEFKNVWFAYNHNDWVLENVSFTLKKGERLAIVGATGAGKTTIISLLCRFYDPVKGSICIDGKDIRSFAPRQIRSLFGVVLQDVFLFSTSVKENIRLWEENLTDAQLRSLADFVNASAFIDQLPEKFEENVRERGGRLSTGQRQLLSFARALAADPQILILDEATANIDTETEQLIQEAIDRLLTQRTAIIIAHRLSTIKHADKIIVLHHGKVVETGTHLELLARNGIYRRLYELQFKEGLNSS